MNRKFLLFVLPFIVLAMMACSLSTVNLDRTVVRGSGTLIKETRKVENVERVSMSGVGDMTIIQGNEEGLTIEADQNIMPYIETTMRGRELVISIKNHVSINNPGKIQYTLKVKNLNRVAISGAGNVTSEKLAVGDFAMDVSGTGNIHIADLQANDVSAKASGSGNFDLKGKVKSQDVTITGAGSYNAGDLQSNEMQATISGAGNMTAWVTDKLNVHITGFGNVNYYGKPSVTQSITGGGSVKGLGAHE